MQDSKSQPEPAERDSAQRRDDIGREVKVPGAVSRVVSLVPSLTETVASVDPGLLTGATSWCSHPPDLAVTRVGGTKNPAIDAIIGLAPDVVLANEEENREPDLDALRAAGLAVWVTKIRDLPGALRLAAPDDHAGLPAAEPRHGWTRPSWRGSACRCSSAGGDRARLAAAVDGRGPRHLRR